MMMSNPMARAWPLRRWCAGLCAAAAGTLIAMPTSAQPSIDDAAVRAAIASCVEAWNRHDPKAFGDLCLTEDAWFSEADDSIYKLNRGRARALRLFDYNIRNTDVRWEVVRVHPLLDGTVAVQLKQRIGVLPRTQDKYATVFDSDPTFTRLRRDGAAWKMLFFTSHAGWARSLLQALDKPAPVRAAQAAASAIDPPAPPGAPPAAYSIQFGTLGTSCFFCHGQRPVVSEDGDRGLIIASGAAAQTAAALRQAMTTPRAGGMMDIVLADPELTDERLDAIRHWLRALRDGHAERLADRIVIRNPRSSRDPPARLVLLRAEGGWRLPRRAGCRQGAALKGGTQCEIRVPAGSQGALVFRFAASPGLQPQEVRLALDSRG